MSAKKTSHHHSPAEEGDFSRVLHAIEKNLKPIFIGLGVLLVLVFVIFLVLHQRTEAEEKAHLAYQTLFEDFRNDERAIYNWRQSEENRELLENYIDKFNEIYENNSQSTFGREALFKTAKLTALSEEYDDALNLFEEYHKRAANDFEKARALNGIGKTYESIAFETGDEEIYKQAISQYERTIANYSELKPYYWNALLNAGTCYIYLDDFDKAEEHLETLLGEKTDQNRDVPFFEEAQSRLEESRRRRQMN